jgi:hypothetical protein
LVAGLAGVILALVCAVLPTLFWFSGGLSGEHAFALLLPIVTGIVLLGLGITYAPVNGIIWAVLVWLKSWRAIPWMLLSLGVALTIPFIPVLVLLWASDWKSCLYTILVLLSGIGFTALVGFLLRKFDKRLVLSGFTIFFLLAGTILAVNGLLLSLGDAVNTPAGFILMLVGGIALGLIGLGFGLVTAFVFLAHPREPAVDIEPATPGDPEATADPDTGLVDVPEGGLAARKRRANIQLTANLLGIGSCLLGLGFIGILALIIVVIAIIWWMFKDFSPVFL